MDLMLLIGIAIALFVVLVTLLFLKRKLASEGYQRPQQQHQQAIRPAGLNRRAQIARNQRNRLRQNAQAAAGAAIDEDRNLDVANDDTSGDDIPNSAELLEKMGTKKRAKMEAKEQKRQLREQELKIREERKIKEAKEIEARKKLEEIDAEQERKQVEAERLIREELERKEYEEYLKLKDTFRIEEEGFEEENLDGMDNLLSNFIQHIKNNKVVVLEEVAVELKMKTKQVIERIQELKAIGALSGVIDDRGKFIYVSEEELNAVAKFIKQRGRVCITELAECSNMLINPIPAVET